MEQMKYPLTKELIDFIDRSPVSFLAVEQLCSLLDENGFVRLYEQDDWKLSPSGKYYVTRNGSSVLAFRLPNGTPKGFMIAASHSDSPSFRLKSDYALSACDRYVKFNTERYGGGILSTWFDRPLSVAGRVLVEQNGAIVTKLFDGKKPLCLIPNVAIHLNRNMNDGFKINPAVDTLPLFSLKEAEGSLETLISDALSVRPERIVSHDLFVYNRDYGTFFGADDAFFCAPRIDDLQCAYTTMRALWESEPFESVSVCAVFDNEEVGSSTKQGAASGLLEDVLGRIADSCQTSLLRMLPHSLMLSCDNGHAMHPNHPELSDAKNAPHLNGGVVIKHNANQKYTTDAVSEALFTAIAKRANVPIQHYANRSDIPGGGTLGSISNTKVALNTVDIGLAQLAMHSAMETAGSLDTQYLSDSVHAFFETTVLQDGDGAFTLHTR